MTCQVVLLNAWGIGLASDSAVTSGNRVSNGSEKIFAVPEPHKLAILTSSRAKVMGFPWESILSAWSESLTKPLASIEEYWLSLEKWLCNSITSTTSVTDAEFGYLEDVIYWKLFNDLYDNVWHPIIYPHFSSNLKPEDLAFIDEGEIWTEEFKAKQTKVLTKEIIKESIDIIQQLESRRVTTHDPATGINAGQSRVWLERYFDTYPSRFNKTFFEELLSNFPSIPGLEEKLTSLAVSYLTNPNWASTMLCLVGFGAEDLLPSALEVEILGFVGGVRLGGAFSSMTSVSSSGHLFYGQKDALNSLVLGQDSILMDATAKQNEAISKFRSQLQENDDEAVTQLREVFESTLAQANIENEVISVGREQRLLPFQKAVQMSPVRDLAEFASTLVGVQSARAAFSQDNPTVGGPIDVATITRHEGFQWLRKK